MFIWRGGMKWAYLLFHKNSSQWQTHSSLFWLLLTELEMPNQSQNFLACLSPLRIFIYATFLCGFSCFGYFFNNIVHSNTSSQPYSPIVHFTFVQDKFNFSIVQNPHLNLALLTYAGEWDPNPRPEISRTGSDVPGRKCYHYTIPPAFIFTFPVLCIFSP